MQKQQQFFQLLSMGGILEHNLNEVLNEYNKVYERKETHGFALESIQEVQTCTSVSQKEF